MPKLVWVLLPLFAYAVYFTGAMVRGRLPSRHALNIQFSLLLMAYLLGTAGLGIFWVANQQLPVFDWHYLFGYTTLLLVSIHLWFNFPLVMRWLRAPRTDAPAKPVNPLPARSWGKVLLVAAAVGAAYYFGGGQEPDLAPPSGTAGGDGVAGIVRFHEFSSESRGASFRRTPGIDWGDAPPTFKRYPQARKVVLARGTLGQRGLSESLRSVVPRTQGMRLADLSDILHLASGVTLRRGGNALRAAPSSGALFPSELYVIARKVEGLAPGIYHFDPDQGRLDVLAGLRGEAVADGSADATIVLASVFRRTGYKYRNRAYRYVTADAGHLLENLRVAAQSGGFHARLLPQFDETAYARLLGIDGVEEGVLAVIDLQGSGAAPAPAPPMADYRVSSVTPNALGVTGTVHQLTSLRTETKAGTVVPLPAAQRSDAPVRQVIAQRRSKRRFTADPVPLAALASILADMVQASQLSNAVRINIVANRVAGLAPGVYRYDPRHALMRVRSGDFASAAGAAALSQDVIGDAAVVLVLSAVRGPMLAEGARGYRHGFLEAGMVGERWLLGAVARGLGACPVGAFYDDEAAALVGIDMGKEWVLHFAALGIADDKNR